MVRKYRKKPVIISAMQWKGNNRSEIIDFVGNSAVFDRTGLYIITLEGEMFASIGDYIIRGVDGEFYPCKSDIFRKTYELVEE